MTTNEKTKIHRKSAVTVGVLFIVGTVAGILSGVLTEPITYLFQQEAPYADSYSTQF